MILAAVLSFVRVAAAADVVVYAAASLQDALTEAAGEYARLGHPKPVLSFGATSLLARQIENGAPADLFIFADEQWADYLASRDLIAAGTRHAFLGNTLVLIANAGQPFEAQIRFGFPLARLLAGGKLAMADPDSVPAGRYGKAALQSLGVWPEVESEVARLGDVRAALTFVERGEARGGIVYRTDALASKKVVIVDTFPEVSHQPIVYPIGMVAGRDSAGARALLDYLLSEQGKAVFVRYGFTRR